MVKVFIGMPVYNGAQFMTTAIDALINQTYTQWELLIADNDSTDQTGSIAKSYTQTDSRIHYVKHDINIGAAANFLFLLNAANSEYFMWAAADDAWHPTFFECCLSGLVANKNFSLSFCNVEIVDSYNQVVRKCESFKKFEIDDKPAQITSFILDAEFSGKANLIYGIYNLSICKVKLVESINKYFDRWGGDIAIVLDIVLLPYQIVVVDEYLFCKRLASPDDVEGKPGFIENNFPLINGVPVDKWHVRDYLKLLNEVAVNSAFESLVSQLTNHRLTLTQNIREFKEHSLTSPIVYAMNWVKQKSSRLLKIYRDSKKSEVS